MLPMRSKCCEVVKFRSKTFGAEPMTQLIAALGPPRCSQCSSWAAAVAGAVAFAVGMATRAVASCSVCAACRGCVWSGFVLVLGRWGTLRSGIGCAWAIMPSIMSLRVLCACLCVHVHVQWPSARPTGTCGKFVCHRGFGVARPSRAGRAVLAIAVCARRQRQAREAPRHARIAQASAIRSSLLVNGLLWSPTRYTAKSNFLGHQPTASHTKDHKPT